MPKIAIVNVGAHGHVNPTVPVVGELVKRGAQVTYFAPEEFRAALTAEGASFEAYESGFGVVAPKPGTPAAELMAEMPARLTGECLRALPQIGPRLKALAPDLIVYDKFSLAARFLAQEMGVKAATFLPSYASNEKFSLMNASSKEDMAKAAGHPAMAKFRADAEILGKAYGVTLRGLPDLFTYFEPLNVSFVARAFHYEGDSFDERFVFAGPSIAPRPLAGRWQPASGDKRPLIFVSLGTVFNAWPEFFSMCFEAFGDGPWRVLMAAGSRVDHGQLGKCPANIELAAHVPQLDVLEQASLFVTHGGMNSTMESLWFGVPMIVVPQMVEQAATARRVAELGLGQAFTRETIDAPGLRRAAEKLLSDEDTRSRVAAMQKQVRASGGQAKAADALMRYAK